MNTTTNATDQPDPCRCSRIAVGLEVTANRNWNPDCPAHGQASEWYRSPEQVERRRRVEAELRASYRAARAARQSRR